MDQNTGDGMRPNTGMNNENAAIDENKNAVGTQNNQTADARSPTYSHGFTMVPPIESRRDKLQRMRQKELDDLERYKEEHRPGPIQLNPETLGGGCVSLAEARQRQQVETRRSKLQKKLQKEEMDRNRRQAEEEEHQRKKTIQREKANRLEMKNKQEEDRRRELYQHDLRMKREEHLQRLEKSSLVPMAASSSSPASSWAQGREHRETRRAEEQTTLLWMKEEQRKKSDILEEKQKQQEEDRKSRMEMERLRVNSAFLDRLEASRSGRAPETLPVTQEGGNVWQLPEPQDSLSSPTPFPSQVWSDGAEDEEEEGEKAEEDTDYDWVVMKLQQNFPYYERDLLKDIVCQCNGNYKQAYDLLNV